MKPGADQIEYHQQNVWLILKNINFSKLYLLFQVVPLT